MKYITRTIWILSLVSLFTDMASEMLYPVLPLYLKHIGFSIVLIGLLEGMAEAVAGLSKGYFGKMSDNTGKRKPFVQLGYMLSAISKPMLAVSVVPVWIFIARTTDRFGKGIRTGARDAMLSDESSTTNKGRVFGFHRSMDTLGAVAGPLLALLYLYFYPSDYQTLFLVAFIPGLLAVGATFWLREKTLSPENKKKYVSPLLFWQYWRTSPALYRKVAGGLLLFALFNSSDVFLLLMAKEAGLSDTTVIGAYIFYNLVYALFAFPLGILADKKGLKTMLLTGLILFAMVYSGMAFNTTTIGFLGLFFLYGVYAAATEGISKAWISNISRREDVATAIGTFTGFQSVCTMAASTFTGLLWYSIGAQSTFLVIAGMTLAVVLYFLISVPASRSQQEMDLDL